MNTEVKNTVTEKANEVKAVVSEPVQSFITRAQEVGREVFLLGLGVYGKMYDLAEDEFDSLRDKFGVRRNKASKEYKKLVKRGKKVQSNAKDALENLDLPKLELEELTDRDKLEARLEKAKARLLELKESFVSKTTA